MASSKPYVLITGSSGLIGTALASRLAIEYPVAGFDTSKPTKAIKNHHWFRVDLTDNESVKAAVADMRGKLGNHIASVVHLAAYYDFSGEPNELYDKVTVHGTRRLIDALRPLRVEQFIFSSTMLVHAPCKPGERIDENHPLDPAWEYPASKLKTEKLVCEMRGDMPVVILRIAGVYDDQCHSIPLAHQIQRIYEDRMISHVYPGDLDCGQSFIHLEDTIESIVLAIQRRSELPPETTLLIGEPVTLSYGELQNRLGELLHGKPCMTQQIPKAIAKAGAWMQDKIAVNEEPFIKPWMVDRADDHYEMKISRARQLLGWEPRHALAETLPKMIEALKTDASRWYREHKLSETNAVVAK